MHSVTSPGDATGLVPPRRPFVWCPLDGQRHAVGRAERDGTADVLRTLCGAVLPRASSGDDEALWPTCDDCWAAARAVVAPRGR